jgi:hypothetical protein
MSAVKWNIDRYRFRFQLRISGVVAADLNEALRPVNRAVSNVKINFGGDGGSIFHIVREINA